MIDFVWFTIKFLMIACSVYWILHSLLTKFYTESANSGKKESITTNGTDKMALKLKAYERLVLYCERISIPKLVQRIKVKGMTSEDLKLALYIAIQQEYDHNITQRIYVSEKLWSILDMTRQQVLNQIGHSADQLDKDDSAVELEELLYDAISEMGNNPTKKAQEAVAAETKLVIA